MLKFAEHAHPLWSFLKNQEGHNLIGTGVVYSLENDEETIKNIYSTDTSIHDTLHIILKGFFPKREDWVRSTIKIEIQYDNENNDGAILKVSQTLVDVTNPNKFNINKGPNMISLSDGEAKELIITLMDRIESNKDAKTKITNSNKIPDSNEIKKRIDRRQFNVGEKIPLKTDLKKSKVILTPQNIDLQDLIRYLQECIHNIFGTNQQSALNSEDFNIPFYGDFA
jgi:hypothetical protein